MKLTQQHLLKHPEKLKRFKRVRIWSGEWEAWWRADGSGYTVDTAVAGIYEAEEAWRRVRHCGPEKRIVLYDEANPKPPSPPDCDWTCFPVCPHCGAADQDWWDGLKIKVEDGTEWKAECGLCENAYTITASVTTEFSTKKPK